MSALPPAPPGPKRTGWSRLWHAAGHSWSGLRDGWHEPAFRLELWLALLLCPAALWLGQGWVERVLLIGAVWAVLIVELLNTAVESVVDRVGPEWHALAKRAKDLGSAAVLLAAVFCGGVWLSALWQWGRLHGVV